MRGAVRPFIYQLPEKQENLHLMLKGWAIDFSRCLQHSVISVNLYSLSSSLKGKAVMGCDRTLKETKLIITESIEATVWQLKWRIKILSLSEPACTLFIIMCLQWRSRVSTDLLSGMYMKLQSQSVARGCLGTACGFQLREMVSTGRHQRQWGKYSRINIQSYNDLYKLALKQTL